MYDYKNSFLMKKRIFEGLEEIEKIINKCEVCYLGMTDKENKPYVLPFNFGYNNKCIYLHSAKEGKKIDILRNNNNVSVAFSTGHQLANQNEDVACSYGMKYKSVVAFGKVVFIDDFEKKKEAMNIIMQKYAGRDFTFSNPAINNVEVYKVVIEKITGAERGY